MRERGENDSKETLGSRVTRKAVPYIRSLGDPQSIRGPHAVAGILLGRVSKKPSSANKQKIPNPDQIRTSFTFGRIRQRKKKRPAKRAKANKANKKENKEGTNV